MVPQKTPSQIKLVADKTAADAALERADAKELHVLFDRAQKRFVEMEDMLTQVVSHFVGEKEIPRYTPSNDNAIAAMQCVAMEALALARFVVEQARTGDIEKGR